MRKNTVIKLITIMLVMLTIFTTLSLPVYGLSMQNINEQINNFEQHGKTEGESMWSEGELSNIFLPIIRILVGIANVVLVVAAVVMGIKYMTTQNSEAKAKLKQQLIGLVVATILVFGAQGIWALVYNLLEKTL